MSAKNVKKSGNKVIGLFFDFLLIVISIIIIIGMYYIFQVGIQKKSYANMFGYTFFEVATGSMSPTIETGDLVVAKLTKDVSEDEIIVYKENKDFITHRLIKIEDDMLITKGDNNNCKDCPITPEQVMGKVVFTIPKVRNIKKVLLSPPILILAFSIIILLIISFFISKDKTEENNEEK